jgi:hypothetical protein
MPSTRERLDAGAFVHGAVAVRDLGEGKLEVEDFPGANFPVRDQVDDSPVS